MKQIELHNKIDALIDAGIAAAVANDVRSVVGANDDARRYFYARADETWLDWLWENGLLEIVADFMLSFDAATSQNLETIDRFLWICTKMRADQLARIAPKIRNERWVPIMGNLNHWGFKYKQMFEILATAEKHESIVTLAEAVLSVRTKEDVKRTSFGSVDNPFYFNDLNHSEVFEHLSKVDDVHAEKVLKLSLDTLAAIIILSGKKEDEAFEYGDMFSLFDVDFFTLPSLYLESLPERFQGGIADCVLQGSRI